MGSEDKINFASDNSAPACPELMDAIIAENTGPRFGYGNDDTTSRMEQRFQELFDCELRAFPVATGTAANVLGLATLTPPFGSIFCHKLSHIQMDECGAPEFYTGGAKLALLDGQNGKLTASGLDLALQTSGKGVVHHVQPSAVSLSQITECGTVYSVDEVSAIGAIARAHGLGLHMDGARFANAVASLNCQPADVTWKAGVDVLSFGGTKNGALAAEAVLFFDQEKAAEFEFRRKRGAHLFSKQRFLSAQLEAYLQGGLWLRLANHANNMARRLAVGLRDAGTFKIEFSVDGNIIFTYLAEPLIEQLEKAGFLFYVVGDRSVARIRLVTSWNTTDEDVDQFLSIVGK